MTTPSTLAAEALNPAKFTPQNNLTDFASYTVPAATASGTIIGMIPFQKGCRVVSGWVQSADLDSSTNVLLNVGYVYVTGSAGTDNDDAFLASSTLPQAGGIATFPVASGASTATEISTTGAADNGYFVIKIGGGATTTGGIVSLAMTFTYGE